MSNQPPPPLIGPGQQGFNSTLNNQPKMQLANENPASPSLDAKYAPPIIAPPNNMRVPASIKNLQVVPVPNFQNNPIMPGQQFSTPSNFQNIPKPGPNMNFPVPPSYVNPNV